MSKKKPLTLRAYQTLFRFGGRIFPKLIGSYAYRLWFRPRRFKTPSYEEPALNKAIRSDLIYKNHKIRIWSWGEGPVVLFLHGWSGRGTQVASFVEPLLNAGFKVVSFDGPAHGESSGDKTDIIEYAEVVQQIISQHGPIHSAITHSFGGMIFALANQEEYNLSKLVMIAAPATLSTPLDSYQETLKLPNGIIEYMQNQLRHDFGNDMVERVSTVSNIQKVKCPILIVHDKGDKTVSWKDSEKIAKNNPNAELMITKELGHRKILGDKALIDKITEFLK